MKLKDKKIELLRPQFYTDAVGNRKQRLVPVATVWAYYRQLSGDEIYRVTTQATEEVLFRINYRDDVTTDTVIRFRGALYDVTRVDGFEGYKRELTVYAKRG